jgi:hypothetical protein
MGISRQEGRPRADGVCTILRVADHLGGALRRVVRYATQCQVTDKLTSGPVGPAGGPHAALVRGRLFLDMVDDHHFERGRLRFQSEAELRGKGANVGALQVDPADAVEDRLAGFRVDNVG